MAQKLCGTWRLTAVLLTLPISPLTYAATSAVPSTLSEAITAGCQWQPIKAAGHPSCLLQQFAGHELQLSLFDPPSQSRTLPPERLLVSSWYQQAKVSYEDLLGNGTRFIRIESEGNTGTGTLQKLVSLWGWHQQQLIPVLLETSSYISEGEYTEKLSMTYEQQMTPDKQPVLRLHFVYSDNHPAHQRHLQWDESLSWQPDTFTFYDLPQQKALQQSSRNPIYRRILAARIKLLSHRHHLQRLDSDFLNRIGMMQILESD